jgi:WhiB family redox-sensing transcriptional regulator
VTTDVSQHVGQPFGRQGPTVYIPDIPPRDGWVELAACAGHDPEHWYVAEHTGPYTYARTVCATCPVKLDCLNWALRADERQGMWGGLSPRQRQQLRRAAS